MKRAHSRLILGVSLIATLLGGCGGTDLPSAVAMKKGDNNKPALAGKSHLSDSEARGKEFYVKGTFQTGREIMASLNGVEVRASLLTCASCHGADGSGRAEGGITPSPIQWETLTKPYGVREPNGRQRPPYTDVLLARAVAMGLDSAGNRLNGAMPHYRLTQDEMADLLSYLKRLGTEPDPGVDKSAIHIGAILPPAPGDAEAVRTILNAYFAKVNEGGGIYQRRVEMHYADSPDVPGEDLFAITASFVGGAEDMLDRFEERRVPVVGTLTHVPKAGAPSRRSVFHLHAGADDQALALAAFGSARSGGAKHKSAAVFATDKAARQLADIVGEECRRLGRPLARSAELTADQVKTEALAMELKEAGVENV